MNQDIKKILDEIYALDDSMREQETELVKAIEYLVAARPEAKVDKAFAKQLRSQLVKRSRELNSQSESIVNTINIKIMNKIVFAAGGAALALIIVIPLLSNKDNNQLIKPAGEQLDFGTGIVEIKESAFGSLSPQEQTEQASGRGAAMETMAVTEAVPAASLLAADNAAVAESAPAPVAISEPGFGGGGMSAKMIMPPFHYRYVYKGDNFELNDSQLPVLRRIKGDSAAADLARRISSIDFGVLDLGSFTNQKVHNFSVAEDKEFGYMIHANLMEGVLNIGQNWTRWPQIDYNQRLKLSDIPSDSNIIKIADKFLKQHNISTDQYASPIVRNEWRANYEQVADKSMYYIPDMAQVVYPLIVDGQVVYDQGGNETGLMMSVSVRHNKVSNVSGLTSQQYESSQYTAITDVNQVVEIAERGGLYPVLYRDGTEFKDIELGTPERVLMKYFHYNNNENQELLTPALVFPIINQPEGQYYRKAITVPLVADLIPDQNSYPEPMPIRIMEEAR